MIKRSKEKAEVFNLPSSGTAFVDPTLIDKYCSNEEIEDLWATPDPMEEERAKLRELVNQLPERLRIVYVERFIKHRTSYEVAEEIGTSQGYVMKLIRSIEKYLKFLHSLPELKKGDLEQAKRQLGEKDYIICYHFLSCGNIHEVNRRLDINRQLIASTIKKALANKRVNRRYKERLLKVKQSGLNLRKANYINMEL